MGNQNLYTLAVRCLTGGRLKAESKRRIGLRSLELVQEKDEWGTSFRFEVNGVPFFAKGGNWIPADTFLNRVSRRKYARILNDCAAAHMNMIRVWGGGVY
jgi:beta-mannosidase